MKLAQPTYDWHAGMLEARIKFWLTIPNADAMVAKIQAELDVHNAARGLPEPAVDSEATRTSERSEGTPPKARSESQLPQPNTRTA